MNSPSWWGIESETANLNDGIRSSVSWRLQEGSKGHDAAVIVISLMSIPLSTFEPDNLLIIDEWPSGKPLMVVLMAVWAILEPTYGRVKAGWAV